MKKNILFMVICMTIASIVSAQTTEIDRGYIGISLGPAIPLGSFVKDGTSTGGVFDAHFAYKLKKNAGLAVLLRGQYHPVNVQSLAASMRQAAPGANTNVESDGWNSGGLMAGIYSAQSLNQKGTIVFELKTLAGFKTTASPIVDMRFSSLEGSGWVRQHSATATAFSYLVNLGMRFNAGKRMAFMLSADYMNYTPNFKNVSITTSMGTKETYNVSQHIQTININAGIAFRLK
ncbi:hypothetical protein [Agriterribacter sp.]|uniref:hypothetical protein n=1 Tax=Agriterribacter sp. TaxID=2821509 RepID=UPI002BC507B8|nr:hypothetical protein [Agriterribacter sp.]HRP57062.1 hypothetical protein [Agriterribacter sp.]